MDVDLEPDGSKLVDPDLVILKYCRTDQDTKIDSKHLPVRVVQYG